MKHWKLLGHQRHQSAKTEEQKIHRIAGSEVQTRPWLKNAQDARVYLLHSLRDTQESFRHQVDLSWNQTTVGDKDHAQKEYEKDTKKKSNSSPRLFCRAKVRQINFLRKRFLGRWMVVTVGHTVVRSSTAGRLKDETTENEESDRKTDRWDLTIDKTEGDACLVQDRRGGDGP